MSTPEPLPQTPLDQHPSRIRFLDGLRGLAILMVVLFHAYARWSDLYPYGARFAGVPVFAYGMLGVQLFFIISGFVIFMTLEKCTTFLSFVLKRWLRLFPAMLICSLFIFATASLFVERPAGAPVLRDLLPGLSLVEPYVWSKLLGSPQGALEGVFWSLYVEVKFYVLFGLMYFALGGRKAIIGLALLFFASALGNVAIQSGMAAPQGMLAHAASLLYWSGAEHYGWFAAGALYYLAFKQKSRRMLGLAIGVACIAALVREGAVADKIAALMIVLAFTMAIVSSRVQHLLNLRVLAWLGVISYPLYLLHENMMVAMIIKAGKYAPWMPHLLMPVLPVLLIAALAALVARAGEPWLRQLLRAGVLRIAPHSWALS
ncbi:acyltransferase family protein [Undibacterium sp. TJN25]|uniref:acyltransferase family protein n=1 Tax=Undibacterium sp. TJN25 TaxID=3413056 RepID=UPI003BF2F4CF